MTAPRVEEISVQEGTKLLLAWMEYRGAVVILDADGFVQVSLDGMTDFSGLTPDSLATVILALRDELRVILKARQRDQLCQVLQVPPPLSH